MKTRAALEYVIAIDPGWHTGYAFWENLSKKKRAPDEVGTLEAAKVRDPYVKMDRLWDDLYDLGFSHGGLDLESAIVECTGFWGSSEKSIQCAKMGHLTKLSELVGGYIRVFRARGVETHIFEAREWKGTMPDSAVKARVRRATGMSFANQHIYDAVGMGLAVVGAF